jgi:hypothetical protein
MKVATLRRASDEYRATALQGVDVAMNILLADRLSDRADRIEAGENDHSTIFPDVTDITTRGVVA